MNGPLILSLSATASLPIGVAVLILRRQRAVTRLVATRVELITLSFAVATATGNSRRLRRGGSNDTTAVTMEKALGFDRKRRAHASVPLRKVAGFSAAIAFGCGLLLHRLLGPVGWAAFVPGVLLLPRLYYARRDRQHSERLFRQFPDALGMIVRAVRVGVGVGNAIGLVATEAQAPTSLEFRQLSEEIAIGLPLPEALRAMGTRNRLPEYRFFATALSLQSQTGGGLAETLETLADTIRKRVAIKLRGHALAAEARVSCYVLGGLPFAAGGGLFLLDPDYILTLFSNPLGEKLLAFAATLLAVGLYAMHAITKRTLR